MAFCKFGLYFLEMNLIIDVGNSLVKIAVFDRREIQDRYEVRQTHVLKTLRNIRKAWSQVDKVMIASVSTFSKTKMAYLEKYYQVHVLSSNSNLPFKNTYSTPKTLGFDRIALVSAAVQNYPSKNALIIDAGSCITYDFINSKKAYLGGAISPGIMMRYKALSSFTSNLPLLKIETPKQMTGDSTRSSMHSGVIHGVLFEIEGVIQKYKLKYSDLTVILTGGDAKFLSKQLKSGIFANSNFLLEGLNYLVEFNIHE